MHMSCVPESLLKELSPIVIPAHAHENRPRQIYSMALYTRLPACTDKSAGNNPTVLCKGSERLRGGYNPPRCWESQSPLHTQTQLSKCSANPTVPTARRTGCVVCPYPKLYTDTEFSGKPFWQLATVDASEEREIQASLCHLQGLKFLTQTSSILNIFYTYKWNKVEETSRPFTFRVSTGTEAEAGPCFDAEGWSHSCHITEELGDSAQAARGGEAWGTPAFPPGDREGRGWPSSTLLSTVFSSPKPED